MAPALDAVTMSATLPSRSVTITSGVIPFSRSAEVAPSAAMAGHREARRTVPRHLS